MRDDKDETWRDDMDRDAAEYLESIAREERKAGEDAAD